DQAIVDSAQGLHHLLGSVLAKTEPHEKPRSAQSGVCSKADSPPPCWNTSASTMPLTPRSPATALSGTWPYWLTRRAKSPHKLGLDGSEWRGYPSFRHGVSVLKCSHDPGARHRRSRA